MIIETIKRSNEAATRTLGFNPADVEQGSIDWLTMRLGVISASNADKLLSGEKTMTRKSYMASLISDVMTCRVADELPFKQLEWGKMYEDSARDALELALGVHIQETAFIYKDESMRCGVSPDGYFENVGVELKCPYDSATFVKFACFDDVKREYERQCQFGMWDTGSDYYIFGNYDPRMTLMKQLHFIEFKRDESMMQRFDDAAGKFIEDMDSALEAHGVKFGDHWAHLRGLRG